MQVRVVRNIKADVSRLDELLRLSLHSAEVVAAATHVTPEVFVVRHAEDDTNVKIFMDFDSLAQYEKLFLEGLLRNADYLTLAERAVDLIEREPRDELLVLMDRDDFFMNLKDGRAGKPAGRQTRRDTRFRTMRHIDVTKGGLRDFMKRAFDFMDRFERAAGFRPDLFCTRFTAERIGCSKIMFDSDDCPMCDSLLLAQTQELLTEAPELLERPPVDELYLRITPARLTETFG